MEYVRSAAIQNVRRISIYDAGAKNFNGSYDALLKE